MAYVLRHYSSYRLADFYTKSFRQGGITYKQLISLFRFADAERYDDMKFHAAIHGIDLDAPAKKETTSGGKQPAVYSAAQSEEQRFMFKDPADYAAMSDEEREKEHHEMMKHWGAFRIRSTPKEDQSLPGTN